MTVSCQLVWPPPYSNTFPKQMRLLSAAIPCLLNFLFCVWFSSAPILQRTPTSESWNTSFFQTRKKIDEYFLWLQSEKILKYLHFNESFNHSESYALFKLKQKTNLIQGSKGRKFYYILFTRFTFLVKMLFWSLILIAATQTINFYIRKNIS